PIADQPSVQASADIIWKQTLRSPNAARTAIILREIFGPPRGVQSPNFVFETMTLALIGCLNCILLPAPHGEMRDDSIPPLRGSSVVAIAVIRLLPRPNFLGRTSHVFRPKLFSRFPVKSPTRLIH